MRSGTEGVAWINLDRYRRLNGWDAPGRINVEEVVNRYTLEVFLVVLNPLIPIELDPCSCDFKMRVAGGRKLPLQVSDHVLYTARGPKIGQEKKPLTCFSFLNPDRFTLPQEFDCPVPVFGGASDFDDEPFASIHVLLREGPDL